MGNAFQDEFRLSLKNTPDVWFTKLFDDSRHFVNQPFDFLVLGMNTNFGIECKQIKGSSLPFANIPEHQETGLLEFKDKLICNLSYLAVNFRNIKKRLNRAFLIDINQYLAFKRTTTRKSLPLEWCDKTCIELERTKYPKGYGWGLTKYLL